MAYSWSSEDIQNIIIRGFRERMEEAMNQRSMVVRTNLPVANVQALAASTNLGQIPERYTRPEVEAEPVVGDGDVEIPVIDLARLLHPQCFHDESKKLEFACQWGFFQLINHGVPDQVIQRMKDDIKEFFKLPLKEKEVFAQLPGYIEGYGQVFVAAEDQKLEWADMMYLIAQPLWSRNLNLWPNHPPTFRATLNKYSSELKKVADCLLRLMARNLDLDPDKVSDMFKEGPQGLRMNYYPPCPQADKVIGFAPHSDGTGITVLLQVDDVPGLQIKKNGKWVPVNPLPDAFIINIGDIIEIMTNGRYKSIEHRAMINTEKERLTIAAFHSPNYDAMVGPLPELVKGGEECYETLSFENYFKLFFSAKFNGRNLLDRLKLKK